MVEVSRRPDGAIEIAVSDDGPGIPDEEKPKVLERFYRGDASRGTPGVGLGLSLVAAVAKLHGGVLELGDNHPGLGACLRLPASNDATPDRAGAEPDTKALADRRLPLPIGSPEINPRYS